MTDERLDKPLSFAGLSSVKTGTIEDEKVRYERRVWLVEGKPVESQRLINNSYEGFVFGFTLIEVLVVVVIIMIAAMAVVPMMGSAASVQLRSASNLIAADLEYAKSLAITRQQNYTVVFDEDTES